jgi:hypothetical protein
MNKSSNINTNEMHKTENNVYGKYWRAFPFLFNLRLEAFTANECNEVFSGDRPCHCGVFPTFQTLVSASIL